MYPLLDKALLNTNQNFTNSHHKQPPPNHVFQGNLRICKVLNINYTYVKYKIPLTKSREKLRRPWVTIRTARGKEWVQSVSSFYLRRMVAYITMSWLLSSVSNRHHPLSVQGIAPYSSIPLQSRHPLWNDNIPPV